MDFNFDHRLIIAIIIDGTSNILPSSLIKKFWFWDLPLKFLSMSETRDSELKIITLV